MYLLVNTPSRMNASSFQKKFNVAKGLPSTSVNRQKLTEAEPSASASEHSSAVTI